MTNVVQPISHCSRPMNHHSGPFAIIQITPKKAVYRLTKQPSCPKKISSIIYKGNVRDEGLVFELLFCFDQEELHSITPSLLK